MSFVRSIDSHAILEFFPETEERTWYFKVYEEFTVVWGERSYTVPKGFETDLASIPQLFQNMIPLVGNHVQAAILHDWCYTDGVLPKDEADTLFIDMMKFLGVSWWQRRIMYRAVRLFGGSSYHGVQ